MCTRPPFPVKISAYIFFSILFLLAALIIKKVISTHKSCLDWTREAGGEGAGGGNSAIISRGADMFFLLELLSCLGVCSFAVLDTRHPSVFLRAPPI